MLTLIGWVIASLWVVAIITGLALVLAYNLAKKGIFLCFPKAGGYTFLDKGEQYSETISGMIGAGVDKEGKVTTTNPTTLGGRTTRPDDQIGSIRNWLWSKFGLYVVGPLPGVYNVHQIKIRRNRIRENPDTSQNDFSKQWIDYAEESEFFDYLRGVFSRPVAVRSVELPDGSTIDFILNVKFKVMTPAQPVYNMPDFMSFIERATESAVVRACKAPVYGPDPNVGQQLTYKLMLGLDLGPQGNFMKEIMKVNKETYVIPTGQPTPGIIEQAGIEAISVDIPAWQADAATVELANAQKAEATAKAKAKGVVATADGDRDAIKSVADGEKHRIEQMIEAMVSKGVSPEVAARQVGHLLETEKLGKTQLTHLVQRGAIGGE